MHQDTEFKPRRKSLKAERTKQRIVIAGAEAVNDSSFDRSPVSEIARRAGVSTGAFYFHFPNKQSLAHTLIEAQNAYSQGKALATFETGAPSVEVMLRASSDYTFDILGDPLVRAGRLATETMVWETPPVSAFDGWIAFYTMLLVQGEKERMIAPGVRVRPTAEWIVGAVTGHYMFATLREDLSKLPEHIMTMWTTFIRAYVTSNPDHWLERADQLFIKRPRPTSLTLEEAAEHHLAFSRR